MMFSKQQEDDVIEGKENRIQISQHKKRQPIFMKKIGCF